MQRMVGLRCSVRVAGSSRIRLRGVEASVDFVMISCPQEVRSVQSAGPVPLASNGSSGGRTNTGTPFTDLTVSWTHEGTQLG